MASGPSRGEPLRVPPFPLIEEPGQWDDLTLVAATCFLEAEGEPVEGILGVCWVIRRRALDWGQGFKGAILGADGLAYGDGHPYEAFSCWGDEYRIRARARLSEAGDGVREPFWKAAAAALWELSPDPVGGASFYLNLPVTKKIRGGSLPGWYDQSKVTIMIGRHTFLRG